MPIKRSTTPQDSRLARARLIENAATGNLPWFDAIKRMRLSLGKTQVQFAEMLGLSRRALIALEAGRGNPSVHMPNKIGRPFGPIVGFMPAANAAAIDRSEDVPSQDGRAVPTTRTN